MLGRVGWRRTRLLEKNQCSWWPGDGLEGLSEQQVRGKRSSVADVEGLVQAGF